MVAEGCAGVVGAEEASGLEDRDYLVYEDLEARREDGRHDVEAVGGACLEPVLDGVGDLFRGAGEGSVAAAAA